MLVLKVMKNSKHRSCSRQSLPGLFDSDDLQPECLAMFFNKEKLTLEETFCFTKSKHAEVKLNPENKILEILPKTVSAFAQKSLRARGETNKRALLESVRFLLQAPAVPP